MVHKKRLFLLAVCGMILCCLSACTFSKTEQLDNSNVAYERLLKLSLELDSEAGFTYIPSGNIGGNFSEDLIYLNVTNVLIEINGQYEPLENALSEGSVSEEDIFYYARIDAKNGVCKEVFESTHGVTNFTYCYPEYDLRIIYDVYETPDGKQHLISDMGIYPPGQAPAAYRTFLDKNSLQWYDKEDWGLSFQISSVSSSGFNLLCTQSGGQQIGELHLKAIFLRSKSTSSADNNTDQNCIIYDETLVKNGTSNILIHWVEEYGNLAPGDYEIDLLIEHSSKLVAAAINSALQPHMDINDLMALVS